MEEEDTKQCPNCKREVPAVNFTTHSVHCARNLRTCPVCKEPVPVAQLQEHHDALHKEVPCKKCGESVCGTDLEDHIRDSCAQTIKPCRYCELELPRSALPAHENYCGARSEQCADCREYVMLKYRQLHLQSNHGFLRLDDDPVPKEAKPKPLANGISNPSNSRPQNGASNSDPLRLRPQTEIRYYGAGSSNDNRPSSYMDRGTKNLETGASSSVSNNVDKASRDRGIGVDNRERNGKVPVKRTNDQPQINTTVDQREKVQKELPSRGAMKKRPAPPPPEPAPDPRRDLPFWSAQKRAQDEERKRQEQSAYNVSVGLPPVLSAAAKLDKLRKMDALHNREVDEDYSHRLRGRVLQPVEPDGDRLGDLSSLQPMSAQQFMDRFQELQLGADRRRPNRGAAPAGAGAAAGAGAGAAAVAGAGAGGSSADRFSEIKSSLRELRRGLNEVTAPYNSASNATNTPQTDSNRVSPSSPPAEPEAGAGGDLRLPCEFCGAAVPFDDLMLHQTGCRPDLTQYRPKKFYRPRSPAPAPATAPAPAPAPRPRTLSEMDEPVIPCEFCTESLPVYLISEHQERCRRDANVLYPD